MKLVRDVITEGVQAYQRGEPFVSCPYEPPPTVDIETEFGLCHVTTNEVDFAKAWESGWNLGELLEQRNGT